MNIQALKFNTETQQYDIPVIIVGFCNDSSAFGSGHMMAIYYKPDDRILQAWFVEDKRFKIIE